MKIITINLEDDELDLLKVIQKTYDFYSEDFYDDHDNSKTEREPSDIFEGFIKKISS